MFRPAFQITPSIAKSLIAIESSRQAVTDLPIDVDVLQGLRKTAMLATVHYSTKIEGNRLTQEQVADALDGTHFPGKERDEAEVRNYFKALERIESLAGNPDPIFESEFRKIHQLVMTGIWRGSAYRTGQNVIRDSTSGGIVHMPPEAAEVPLLMTDLFGWINAQLETSELPAPIVAAMAHYQYATIHPYYDGNGRTARLLTTLVLHKTGFGLKGLYSLEEHYAKNLSAYYAALSIGPSHNYHLGRAEAEVTPFIEFFCRSMAQALDAVRRHASASALRGGRDISAELRQLDPRKRRVVSLFRESATLSNTDMATLLKLSPRTMTALSRQWVDDGFLVIANESRKSRTYRLSDRYESLIAPAQG